jgi:hypothetical protein
MKNFISLFIFLILILTSCKDQEYPPYIYQLVKIDIIHSNYIRSDTLSMIPKIHYRGKVQHFGGVLKQLDTTFVDVNFIGKFFEGITDTVLVKTTGNLPAPKDSLPSFYTLSLKLANGDEHTIEYSQKIPEIDSLRSRFEQFYLKLLP